MVEPTPFPTLERFSKGGPVDSGDGGGEDDDMRERVAALEAKFETVLPTLATKADVEQAKSSLVIWIIGTALAAAGLVVAGLNYMKAPAPTIAAPTVQPPIIIYAQPGPALTQPAPAPTIPAPQK